MRASMNGEFVPDIFRRLKIDYLESATVYDHQAKKTVQETGPRTFNCWDKEIEFRRAARERKIITSTIEFFGGDLKDQALLTHLHDNYFITQVLNSMSSFMKAKFETVTWTMRLDTVATKDSAQTVVLLTADITSLSPETADAFQDFHFAKDWDEENKDMLVNAVYFEFLR